MKNDYEWKNLLKRWMCLLQPYISYILVRVGRGRLQHFYVVNFFIRLLYLFLARKQHFHLDAFNYVLPFQVFY